MAKIMPTEKFADARVVNLTNAIRRQINLAGLDHAGVFTAVVCILGQIVKQSENIDRAIALVEPLLRDYQIFSARKDSKDGKPSA